MDPREHANQEAIRGFENGTSTSLRKAAIALNVPRSTIHSRMLGYHSHAIAHKHRQRLSPEQEESLKEWIIIEDSRFQPPWHPRVKDMAARTLRENGDHEPLGKRWLQHFIARNPSVSSMVSRKIDSLRASPANPDNIRAFLELFERTRTQLRVHQEDIWNMDETGLALGVCTNTQVVAKSTKKKTCEISRKSGCLAIFKGKFLETAWSPAQNVPDWVYTTSENGLTSNETGLEWLKQIFIPGSAPRGSRNRILILDGHASHTDVEFIWQCRQNKIHCLYFPPHSSHVLQPLDPAPFSVLKTKYRSEIAALSVLNDAAPIKKEHFVVSYKAREEGLSERVIRASWRATGLSLYNLELVLASSQVSQRPTTPPNPGLTPNPPDLILSTHRSSQALHKASRELQTVEPLSRGARTLIRKAGKALPEANARAALSEFEKKQAQHQLDSSQTTISRR
ncbi:hypothetical protein K3495_g7947 [Podosphaera aphanis]|nr:hypothetical protein K3495_g7947 [Podosphaera aphanis]